MASIAENSPSKDTTVAVTLSGNGLIIPADFPVDAYESIYKIIVSKQTTHPLYEHFAGAWNALAYRFRAAVDHGESFAELINTHGSTPPPAERYAQEKELFDFFSAGFATFEATFYGLYTVAAFISPKQFFLTSPKDQQQVSPTRTRDAYTRAFPSDPILSEFSAVFADAEFQKFREIRNILTHRTAPGRRIYVSIGSEDAPATEWKLNNSPLDKSISANGRKDLVRLLRILLQGGAEFVTRVFGPK